MIYHNWDEIRRLMWDYVGIVRTDKRLKRASARLRNLQREIQEFYWNFKSQSICWSCATWSRSRRSLSIRRFSRKESRGLHYTLDYPQSEDRQFRRDTLISRA